MEKGLPKLYTEKIPLSHIHFLPQGGKKLFKRQEVSALDLNEVVFVEHRPPKYENPSDNTLENMESKKEEQIKLLQNKLDEISSFKQKVKNLSNNQPGMKESLEQIKNQLKIKKAFTSKEDALYQLKNIKEEKSTLKWQLKKLNFSDIDVQGRCSDLLQRKGVRGFHYTIKSPLVSASARTRTNKYANTQEYLNSKNACLSWKGKKSLGSKFDVAAFAFGGIGMASREYVDRKGLDYEKECTNSENTNVTTAVAQTRTVIEIITFEIEKARIDKDGINLLRAIGRASEESEKEIEALRFLDKYPSELNMGPFGIGGYFEYTATTKSKKSVSLYTLQSRAAFEAEKEMSVAVEAFFGVATALADISVRNNETSGDGLCHNDSLKSEEVTTQVDYDCSRLTVKDVESLQENLTDPSNWTCFPSIDVSNHKYKSIWAIVQDMAMEGREVDIELENAARVLQYLIQKGTRTIIPELHIPENVSIKNVIVFGKSGSGKSTLGNVLLGKYENGESFETSDSKESCTEEPSSLESTARKIKYYDTTGTFDTKAYNETTGVFTANAKVIRDIINIWEAVGDDGIHAILFTISFSEKCSSVEAKLAKFAGSHLFEGDGRNSILLIMTRSPERFYINEEEANAWLEKQKKSQKNHINDFFKLVEYDHSRVIFVDCKMPKEAPDKESEFEYKKHNVWMAEKVLSKIHALKEDGIVVPAAGYIRKKRILKEKLDAEKRKLNPDKKKLDSMGK